MVGVAGLSRAEDRAAVAALLGREPGGAFEVVVRHADGSPLVIANAPLLDDGTPMPTRYWLVGEPERTWIGRLESAGGVNRAEAEVDATALAEAHARYAAARDALLPAGHDGPRPSGGVGGTRHRGEVPARALRVVAGRRRRSGGSLGGLTPRRGR